MSFSRIDNDCMVFCINAGIIKGGYIELDKDLEQQRGIAAYI